MNWSGSLSEKAQRYLLIPSNDKIKPIEIETTEADLVRKLNYAYDNDTLIAWTVGLCYVDKLEA